MVRNSFVLQLTFATRTAEQLRSIWSLSQNLGYSRQRAQNVRGFPNPNQFRIYAIARRSVPRVRLSNLKQHAPVEPVSAGWPSRMSRVRLKVAAPCACAGLLTPGSGSASFSGGSPYAEANIILPDRCDHSRSRFASNRISPDFAVRGRGIGGDVFR